MYEYYNNYLCHESDNITQLDAMCGEDAGIYDLRDELEWEAVAQIHGGHREGQRSDHSRKERCTNPRLLLCNNSRNNESSTRKFVEGVADWYTLPRNNNGIGKNNAVTSSRLLELISYEGQVLNSINHMDAGRYGP